MATINIKKVFFDYQRDFKNFKTNFIDYNKTKIQESIFDVSNQLEKLKELFGNNDKKINQLELQINELQQEYNSYDYISRKKKDYWEPIVEPYWQETKQLLKKHQPLLELITKKLLEKETLQQTELETLKNTYLTDLTHEDKKPFEINQTVNNLYQLWAQLIKAQTQQNYLDMQNKTLKQQKKESTKELNNQILSNNKLLKGFKQTIDSIQTQLSTAFSVVLTTLKLEPIAVKDVKL